MKILNCKFKLYYLIILNFIKAGKYIYIYIYIYIFKIYKYKNYFLNFEGL